MDVRVTSLTWSCSRRKHTWSGDKARGRCEGSRILCSCALEFGCPRKHPLTQMDRLRLVGSGESCPRSGRCCPSRSRRLPVSARNVCVERHCPVTLRSINPSELIPLLIVGVGPNGGEPVQNYALHFDLAPQGLFEVPGPLFCPGEPVARSPVRVQ